MARTSERCPISILSVALVCVQRPSTALERPLDSIAKLTVLPSTLCVCLQGTGATHAPKLLVRKLAPRPLPQLKQVSRVPPGRALHGHRAEQEFQHLQLQLPRSQGTLASALDALMVMDEYIRKVAQDLRIVFSLTPLYNLA